jgi:hypothetical protein
VNSELPVDPAALREEVKGKYRDVGRNPNGEHHFHTGGRLARRLGYDAVTGTRPSGARTESCAP